MRALIVFLLAILCLSNSAIAGKKLRVLFLGNSYTHYNNMPQLVGDMATSTGDTLVFDMYAPGGYTLDDHDNDLTSFGKISQGGWDYMVLQEQSQLPAIIGGLTTGIGPLVTSFKQYNPCGRVMLYMTWGRKNGDALNCTNYPHVCTYLGMDSAIRDAYETVALNYKTELSPVGAAWRRVRATNPLVNLYEPDDSHPTASGSYLAAACFYTALFKKDPTAVSYNFSVPSATAGVLRQAAKAVVFDSLSFLNHVVTMPVADFFYYIGAGVNQVNCVNTSKNADTYHWDFGDGNFSTAASPMHNYMANGTYTITLTAFNCDLDTTYKTTYQKTVTFCAHTPSITPLSNPLCPGTTDTLWTQPYDSYQWYDEYDDPVPGATSQFLEVSNYGVYHVAATVNGCTELSAPSTVQVANMFSPWFIMQSGKLVGTDTACVGDTVTLEVKFNKPPVAHDTLIDWSFNGQPISGYHNDTLLITQPGLYQATVRHHLCPNLYKTNQVSMAFVECPNNVSEVMSVPFTVAPNPVTGTLTISSAAFNAGEYVIQLTNSVGKALYRQPSAIGLQQTIDMSPYSSGIYFISVTGKHGVVYRGKLIKQ